MLPEIWQIGITAFQTGKELDIQLHRCTPNQKI
jgi:hypothetical protein